MTAEHPSALPLNAFPRDIRELHFGNLSVCLDVVSDTDQLLGFYADTCGSRLNMLPYYAMLWPSAEALVDYLVRHYPSLRGKRVLELGCGLALPSMICAMLGATVDAVDFHPDCLSAVDRNAELNHLTTVRTRCASWDDVEDDGYDLIIGSDLLYEAESIDSLSDCLARLRRAGTIVVLSDPGRNHLQEATDRICEKGFTQNTQIVGDCFVIVFEPVPGVLARTGA
jgi:predicted nicotinamide N-methyase